LLKVRLAGEVAAAGTPAPVPAIVAVWVVPPTLPALSVTVNVAVREPLALGLNVMAMLQLALAAKLVPQVLVCEKSPEFVPAKTMLVIVKVPLPVLVNVTLCAPLALPTAWLGKVTLATLRLAAGVPVPVPLNCTTCVLPGVLLALSVIVSVAVRLLPPFGVNVTLMLQFVPATNVAPQVFVSEKSPELVPPSAMLDIVRDPVPELLTVTVSGVAEEPTFVLGNASEAGETLAVETARPTPVNGMVCVEPARFVALSTTVIDAPRLPEAAGVKLTVRTQLAVGASLAVHVLFANAKSLA